MNYSSIYTALKKQKTPKDEKPLVEKQKKSFMSKIFENFHEILFKKNESKNLVMDEKNSKKDKKKMKHHEEINLSALELVKNQQQNKSTNSKKKSKKVPMLFFILAPLIALAFFGMYKNITSPGAKKDHEQTIAKAVTDIKKTEPTKTEPKKRDIFSLPSGDSIANTAKDEEMPPLPATAPSNGNAEIKRDTTVEQAVMQNQTSQPQQQDESSLLLRKFCNSNKINIEAGIGFLIDENFALVFSGRKLKIGDPFVGLSRNDLFLKNVNFASNGTRIITLADGIGNTCEFSVPWHNGLDIKVLFDALDIKETISGNLKTILPGEGFSGVKLLDIIEQQNQLMAKISTPAETLLYRGK